MSGAPIVYEAVIGLEVHVQVRTNSKMFSDVLAMFSMVAMQKSVAK